MCEHTVLSLIALTNPAPTKQHRQHTQGALQASMSNLNHLVH
jgi:hypothetical protein